MIPEQTLTMRAHQDADRHGRGALPGAGVVSDAQVDPLDLAGAAEVAAVTVRRRLVELAERLATEQDAAAIRDIAIGLAALGSAAEALDELADREVLHKAFLANVRDSIRDLLCEITRREWDGDIEYTDSFPELLVRTEPRGDDEGLPEGMRPFFGRRAIYQLRDAARTLDDRLYGYDPDA